MTSNGFKSQALMIKNPQHLNFYATGLFYRLRGAFINNKEHNLKWRIVNAARKTNICK